MIHIIKKFIILLSRANNNTDDIVAAHTEKQYPQSRILCMNLKTLYLDSNKDLLKGSNSSDLTTSSVMASVKIIAANIINSILI